MLVLSRKLGESLQIGDNITVTVLAVHGRIVRLGIEAPPQVRILRGELAQWHQGADESFDDSSHAEPVGV
jgi:carbon storage regulator